MNERFEFGRPDFDIEPSPIDLATGGNVYLRSILVFELSSYHDREAAQACLKASIEASVQELPILARTVTLEDHTNTSGLSYKQKAYGAGGKAILVFKDVSDVLDYEALKGRDFPSAELLPDILSPAPSPRNAFPPTATCQIQANFSGRGLFLFVCLHHFAFDATAMSVVLEVLASHCQKACKNDNQRDRSKSMPSALDKLLDRSKLWQDDGTSGDLNRHTAWTIQTEAPQFSFFINQNDKVISERFKFTPEAIRRLKSTLKSNDSTTSHGSEKNGDLVNRGISRHDVLSALVWRTVMAARKASGILEDDSQVVTFGFAVDSRQIMGLPAKFVGNAAVVMQVNMELGQLLSSQGIAIAARGIRNAVNAVTEGHTRNFIGLIKSLPHIGHLWMTACVDVVRHQILLTSWRKCQVPQEWGPAMGDFKGFRLPFGGIANGIPVILPAATDGSFEVDVTLEERVMKSFKVNRLWTDYVDA